ncbi:MAG: Bax inhibitor-1/YccA family protein [SAR86 cluster bacterium]|uniref:Bax inhibitor-1/YccA family protein n=1 Tax=SAR86 cluster bacterium TaxID=2030880 RepID=A0A937SH13_9GAMM|nr:Bax inhibitor-1/YccA family protein [SAR86 cluster bacterium]
MSKHSAINTFGRSGNPAFKRNFDQGGFRTQSSSDMNTASGFRTSSSTVENTNLMTLDGAVNKTGILLALCFSGAFVGWNFPALAIPCALLGFVLAMVTIFRSPEKVASTAPFYAIAQGIFLGGVTMMFEGMYPGIAVQALGLTFGITLSLLFCYKSGLIKPTENFKLMIVSATAGIAILYLVSFIMSMFGSPISFIHSNGLMGIGFSVFVVGIAALNLVLDFDFIEEGAEVGLPKYMEWYGAFSLMVTLVWLYLEILRLLAKIASRR